MFVSFETRLNGSSREAQHVSPSRGGIFVILEVSLNGTSREAQETLPNRGQHFCEILRF